jgi:predicted transcriptional regulator
MTTFTSSLPDDLLELLEQKAHALSLPKNKLMERALRLYLQQISKAEYVRSYRRMQQDEDILTMAEEGLADYFTQLEDE